MSGAYCQFCDHRCFVERVLPEPHRCSGVCAAVGHHLHLATCPAGRDYDRHRTGFDSTTAINPHAHQ